MRINNKNWKLVRLNASDDRLKRSDGISVLGVCDNNTKTIYINQNLQGKLLDRVILHEITHVFCFEYGLNLDIAAEEILCDFMATYGREVIAVVDNILSQTRRYA
jgi:Zn-dependent peptidase ImmA (M78 family)